METGQDEAPAGLARRALDALYLWAGYASGFFLLTIFALMLVMSLGREVGINVPAGDEFASWAMAACAFLGLAHTFKSGEMIRVGLVIDRFTGRTRTWIEAISLLVGISFAVYFAYHAIVFTQFSWLLGDRAQGVVPVPLWIPQLGYAGGLTLLAMAMIDEFVRLLMGKRPSYFIEPPKTAEEAVERAASSAV